MAAGATARQASLAVLRGVREGQPFEVALARAAAALDERDTRLVHEISAGILRSRGQLDAELAPLVPGRWGRLAPELRDLLRIGAYQLRFLSRVPAYAAVQSTVEVAKRTGGRRAAGMVNAVLRRLVDAPRQPAPHDSEGGHSHPAWLAARWRSRFGPARTESLLRHNNTRPPLVIQPARESRDALEAALSARGIPFREAALGMGLEVVATNVRALPGYAAGAFIVQDPAHAWLLDQAGIPDAATVWDACAAPGGKAALLARRCRVVAADLRRDRLVRLRDTVTRAAPDVSLVLADARLPPVRSGAADVVLVDAPCSATGTMARHPDARWRLTARRIARAARRQREILDGVAEVLGPGRLLVYMTCSLEAEENEDQVAQFLARHAEFARDGEDHFVFPPDAGTDGGYVARLRRRA